MVAIHEDLNPKLIEEYSDEFELLVVETDTKEKSIRVISGYGPQENLDEEKRLTFFLALEVEIEKAELAGKSVIIEMDANSKLGEKYIKGDPHKMSPNGALLAGIIERHGLVVGNGSDKCKGTITRKRVTKDHTEESVIDLVLFSSDLNKHLAGILVDEKRNHVLTRITKSKRGIKVKESDHNVIITEFDCKTKDREENVKEDVYNLKNKTCQETFKKLTSETSMLSSSIEEKGDIDKVIKRFIKKLNGCIAMTFKKNRVNHDKVNEEDILYDKRRELKGKEDDESKAELENVNKAIAEANTKNFEKLKDELSKLKKVDGKIN